MSVDPTRRRFLSTAVTLAAGSAALGLAIPPAFATDDPIFVAIEAHKAAFARVIAAVDVEYAAEAENPKDDTRLLNLEKPPQPRGKRRGMPRLNCSTFVQAPGAAG